MSVIIRHCFNPQTPKHFQSVYKINSYHYMHYGYMLLWWCPWHFSVLLHFITSLFWRWKHSRRPAGRRRAAGRGRPPSAPASPAHTDFSRLPLFRLAFAGALARPAPCRLFRVAPLSESALGLSLCRTADFVKNFWEIQEFSNKIKYLGEVCLSAFVGYQSTLYNK